MPEQDKQLIRLRFYGNRTQSETAKALAHDSGADLPAGTQDLNPAAHPAFGGISGGSVYNKCKKLGKKSKE
ncbi:MAG: hypothetical protein ACLT9S_11155 [Faecalibacterium sp.]